MKIELRLKEIAARKAEIRKSLEENGVDLKLDEIKVELEGLETEERALNDKLEIMRNLNSGAAAGNHIDSPEEKRAKEQQKVDLATVYEKRGADLKDKRAVTFSVEELPELRAVTVGGGTLVIPTQYSNSLNPTFNQVSSVIDKVSAIPCNGGNAYQKGFEVSYGEGDYTTETGDYTNSDPVTDYVDINKAKITAYTEISDEAIKLPNINYQALVAKNIGISLRKKITKQILTGTGGTNTITGIFNAPTNVIPTATDLTISAIDADTLDTIVFNYGGDEDVEGAQYLILNKKDLAAFAAVRDLDGKKLYKITLNGNEGTISSSESFAVPFIINSAVAPLSATATSSGAYCMAYGRLNSYELPVYSDVVVEESRDYKFRSGQIAYRGAIWVGGNVAAYKGFIRVKKA